MIINLGGKTLSTTNVNVGVDVISGSTIIDGRLDGSTIKTTHSEAAYAVQVRPGSSASLNGGDYLGNSDAGHSVGINNYGTMTISDCNISGYANVYFDGTSYRMGGMGIYNNGVLNITNSCVMGTVAGINNQATLYVVGGLYEGFDHGGFRFEGGGSVSYVRNATIRECEMPDGYTAFSSGNEAGFYIMGDSNINVYMDNCDIYGSLRPIVFYGGGCRNNTLYISNSRIHTDQKILIGNDTHKLYIGKGCNFTAEHTNNPSAVITTDEVYTQSN